MRPSEITSRIDQLLAQYRTEPEKTPLPLDTAATVVALSLAYLVQYIHQENPFYTTPREV